MAELTQPLDVNTLYNVYVIEELIQLIVGPYADTITNPYWIDYSQGSCSSA